MAADEPPSQRRTLTRDALASGAVADLAKEVRLLTDDQRQASLDATLADWDGSDVWLFGYGSLIWNPTIRYEGRAQGRIYGYHRQFCLWIEAARGTKERPGLMLGLDSGGSCQGLAYRIAADLVGEELSLVWRREMATGAYRPVWTTVHTGGASFRAITFVVDKSCERYTGRLPTPRIAQTIARAEGFLGTCAEYLFNTVDGLNRLGIHDGRMSTLANQVRAITDGTPSAPK
jgi:cation transport protein ChaC